MRKKPVTVKGGLAVMQRRREPPNSLDFFPTPPWGTRALLERVLLPRRWLRCGEFLWDPACGEGHMSWVLQDYGPTIATDVFDYGSGEEPWRRAPGWVRTLDFLDDQERMPAADWIITNPPFNIAEEFARRSLQLAKRGVALLVRAQWLQGQERYETIFRRHPPTLIAYFVERLPMAKGRWDPDGSTATDYVWIVWVPGIEPQAPFWIPPGQRTLLDRPADRKRFVPLSPIPLFETSSCSLDTAA